MGNLCCTTFDNSEIEKNLVIPKQFPNNFQTIINPMFVEHMRNPKFRRIDEALHSYYKEKGIRNYKNRNGIGKFLSYCRENNLKEDDIDNQLSVVAANCIYLNPLIKDFPFNPNVITTKEKQNELFEVLKYCHKHGKSPPIPWNLRVAGFGCLGSIDQLENCISVRRLRNVLCKYSPQQNQIVDIQQILNDFIHLIRNHNDDKSFEAIYVMLGAFCDHQKCHMLQRLYSKKLLSNVDTMTNVNQQIMDKIHCYYKHCYDFGCRLTSKERTLIQNEYENYDSTLFGSFKIGQIKKRFCGKQKTSNSRTLKFIDFTVHNNNCQEEKHDDIHDNVSMYSFGFIFDYGKHSEHCTIKDEAHEKYHQNWTDHYIGKIENKYLNLKEELLDNALKAITINQFDIEFKKADTFYNTDY
eukprot:303706_1